MMSSVRGGAGAGRDGLCGGACCCCWEDENLPRFTRERWTRSCTRFCEWRSVASWQIDAKWHPSITSFRCRNVAEGRLRTSPLTRSDTRSPSQNSNLCRRLEHRPPPLLHTLPFGSKKLGIHLSQLGSTLPLLGLGFLLRLASFEIVLLHQLVHFLQFFDERQFFFGPRFELLLAQRNDRRRRGGRDRRGGESNIRGVMRSEERLAIRRGRVNGIESSS